MSESSKTFENKENAPVIRDMKMLGVEVVDIDEPLTPPEEESEFQRGLRAIQEAERQAWIEGQKIVIF